MRRILAGIIVRYSLNDPLVKREQLAIYFQALALSILQRIPSSYNFWHLTFNDIEFLCPRGMKKSLKRQGFLHTMDPLSQAMRKITLQTRSADYGPSRMCILLTQSTLSMKPR